MPQIVIYLLAGALAAAAFYVVAIALAPRVRTWSAQPKWHANGPLVLGALAAAVAFVAVFLIAGGGSRNTTAQEAKVLDEVHRYRFVQVLEKYQPEARRQIEALVHEAVTRDDPGFAESRTAELVQSYFPRYVPATSDDAIVRFASALVDILTYLERNDAETCKTLATGGRLGAAISPDRMTPVLDAMADVIEDGASKPQAPPDKARAQTLVQGVTTTLYAGKDDKLVPMEVLMTPQRAPADKLCHTMQSFYRTVIALPKADASVVLRSLIGALQ